MELRYEKNRIFAVNDDRVPFAEIDFRETKPGVITITHTDVDTTERGKGIAEQLVVAAVEEIERRGCKPEATCTYAAEWLLRNR